MGITSMSHEHNTGRIVGRLKATKAPFRKPTMYDKAKTHERAESEKRRKQIDGGKRNVGPYTP